MQRAFSSIIGPLISYATIAVAALLTRKRYSAFLVILALSAPLGRDEFNFSRSLNIEPLLVCVPTMGIVAITWYVFGRKAWRQGGWKELGLIIVSIMAGLAFWSIIGPILLR